MSLESNKELVQRYQEIYNSGKLEELSEVVAPNLNSHTLFPGLPAGLEGGNMAHGIVMAAFPDQTTTTEDLIAEDDKVVQRFTIHGTHKGEFMGAPPTGKTYTITGISIFRIADGKIVEHWANMDTLGAMQQLGMIPTPGN